ncbi:uncharacterized protein KGF55_002137 [Candida pseudojiufengensis]|uniref:uncharacterized protein n=1 Tax=Candida pseudojiufengensis TaxID=497109 RepID=UPI002224DA6E|nr:uncharacterized protein KGF55_002137 [Candida pseudojiufengensis]KAI5964195.1 hypothetical protein KGF55_002137 [Candida pseudojiufengensis]
MISNSPDAFHQTRVVQSQIKSSNVKVQQMEHKSHNNIISEYQLDMLEHLLTIELKSLPNLLLIEQQPEIKLSMRPLLLDFLMEVITILNLSRSTFPLTVNLIDRYCSTRIVKKQHYQLLGLTSLWISCKNLDSKFKIPTLNDLRKICVDSYNKELFIEMEKHILKSLEWQINCSTFDSFVDVFLNLLISIGDTNSLIIKKNFQKIKISSYYLGELFQFYPNLYFNYSSSQIAILSIMSSISTLVLPINIVNILSFYNSLLDKQTIQLNLENFQQIFKLIKSLSLPNSIQQKYGITNKNSNNNTCFNNNDGSNNLNNNQNKRNQLNNRNLPPKTPKVSMPLTPGPSPEEKIDRKRRCDTQLMDQSMINNNNINNNDNNDNAQQIQHHEHQLQQQQQHQYAGNSFNHQHIRKKSCINSGVKI